jgi:hypothetical protein
MGYEASLAYDPQAHQVIRWGGHNQGGGGEQNAETWILDPVTSRWVLREPNTSPPGVCCAQQNVFDLAQNRFLRFPAFSGNHGWQWFREIYLNNSPVWSYELSRNTWRDLRPLPAPRVSPLRCAAWDSDHQVVVVFGGEGNDEGTVVYDPYTNAWTRRHPRVQPAFRSGGNLAYDAAHRLHILFGSQFGDDPHTWAYDLPRNEWSDLKPAVQPPTDRNDAVLAYDAVNRVVLAVVRVIDKADKDEVLQGHLETWAYDAGRNAWRRVNPPREPDGKGNRRRILVAVPEQNLILMENYINPAERIPGVEREQQIWTYRYAAAKSDSVPQPPRAVQITTTSNGALLSWQPSPSPDVESQVVYRGEGAQPWLAHYEVAGRVAKSETSWHDGGLKPGKVYFYCVRAVTRHEQESSDSPKVRTQPRVVEDAVVSVLTPREVRLSWDPPLGGDVAGYHIERANVEVFSDDQIRRLKQDTEPLAESSVGAIKAIGRFARITEGLVKDTVFIDTSVNLTRPLTVGPDSDYIARFRPDQLEAQGKPYRYAVYAYRVRAVNALGVESGASPYFLTIPRAPEQLFSREEGEHCHLRWAASPEQPLSGYRLYRMESPRRNGPGQPVTRVTADPVAVTRYDDAKAGQVTRRYWVVAVDALGQEGFPSAPTWHYREYRRYYAPFAGEWHQ